MEQLTKVDLGNTAKIHIESYERLINVYEKMLRKKYESKELKAQHKAELKQFRIYLKNWTKVLNDVTNKEQQ